MVPEPDTRSEAERLGLDEPADDRGDGEAIGGAVAICRECRHVLATYRYWRYWMCSRDPIAGQIMNYVTGEKDRLNQYGYCRYKNSAGKCADYEAIEGPPRVTGNSQYEPHREPG